MDLDAYFERIGWRGGRTATADVLAGLVGHHVRAIPFENVDVLLGRKIRLDVEGLEAKLVRARRGGYCFEHASLFAAALRELGFTVHCHSARVVMLTPRDSSPRTHMFLTAGDVVLDPGFGRQAPMLPVPLDGTPAGEHHMVREGGEVALYLGPQRLWVSSLERDLSVDFEMANHFTATHPSSPFVHNLMARAILPDGKLSIMNRDATLARGGSGSVETWQVQDRAALRALFAEHFGFDLPELEHVRVPAIADWE